MAHSKADLWSFLAQVEEIGKCLHIAKPVCPASEVAALSPEDLQMLPNNRWAIDATKPSLAEPQRRSEFVRLKARGQNYAIN